MSGDLWDELPVRTGGGGMRRHKVVVVTWGGELNRCQGLRVGSCGRDTDTRERRMETQARSRKVLQLVFRVLIVLPRKIRSHYSSGFKFTELGKRIRMTLLNDHTGCNSKNAM